MTIGLASVLPCALLVLNAECEAQPPSIGIGLRAGASQEVSDDAKGRGRGSYDSNVSVRFGERFSLHLMTGLAELGTHATAENVSLESNGFAVGLEAMLGTRSGRRPRPWVRAGLGGFQVLAAGGSFDSLDEGSPFSLGIDLAAGLDFALTPSWHLSPGIRVVDFSPDWEFVSPYESGFVGQVRYVALDIGLMYWLGARKEARRR